MRRRAEINDRDTSGAIDFDAALETFLETGDAEELRASALVVGSTTPLDEERDATLGQPPTRFKARQRRDLRSAMAMTCQGFRFVVLFFSDAGFLPRGKA